MTTVCNDLRSPFSSAFPGLSHSSQCRVFSELGPTKTQYLDLDRPAWSRTTVARQRFPSVAGLRIGRNRQVVDHAHERCLCGATSQACNCFQKRYWLVQLAPVLQPTCAWKLHLGSCGMYNRRTFEFILADVVAPLSFLVDRPLVGELHRSFDHGAMLE